MICEVFYMNQLIADHRLIFFEAELGFGGTEVIEDHMTNRNVRTRYCPRRVQSRFDGILHRGNYKYFSHGLRIWSKLVLSVKAKKIAPILVGAEKFILFCLGQFAKSFFDSLQRLYQIFLRSGIGQSHTVGSAKSTTGHQRYIGDRE